MIYKIVGVNDSCPDKPEVYRGKFERVLGEPPLLTALVTEFGDGDGNPAVKQLEEWSDGESKEWAKYLKDDDVDYVSDFKFENDDTTFYVFVADDGLEL